MMEMWDGEQLYERTVHILLTIKLLKEKQEGMMMLMKGITNVACHEVADLTRDERQKLWDNKYSIMFGTVMTNVHNLNVEINLLEEKLAEKIREYADDLEEEIKACKDEATKEE